MAGRGFVFPVVSFERQLAGGIKGVAIYASNAAAETAAEAVKKNSDAFTRALGRAISKRAFPESRTKAAHTELARQAQTAILTGWKDRLPVNAPPYRRGSDPDHDRLSGTLGEALASDQMIRGTTGRTISFLNTTVLWEEARHWHRVNYGAFGPNATIKRPEEFPVTIDGHTLFKLHDPGQPDPNSWLPKRWVASRDRRSYFAPKRGEGENKADVPGGGHRSALFTDLGYRSVAANFGATYEAMLRRWAREEGEQAVRKALYAKGVRVPKSVRLV